MGFLDHSTNNIIIDAVLTNLGREILASNAGAFQISKFSLADDEVDYSMIRKFGRTIGKEKIIKNTPIFEAQTAQDIALKYPLISISDPSVTHLPIFNVGYSKGTGGTVTAKTTVSESVTQFNVIQGGTSAGIITVNQTMPDGKSVPAGLNDTQFDVFANHKFISISQSGVTATHNSMDPLTNMSRYALAGSGQVTFTVAGKTLSNSDFNFYGDATSGKQVIKTMLSVVGKNSGTRVDIIVGIQKNGS